MGDVWDGMILGGSHHMVHQSTCVHVLLSPSSNRISDFDTSILGLVSIILGLGASDLYTTCMVGKMHSKDQPWTYT
jgi:hypothetical protein